MNGIDTKERKEQKSRLAKPDGKAAAAEILRVIIYAVCGFVFSGSRLLSSISPLGPAFAAACPKKGLLLCFSSSVLGIITGAVEHKLHCLAALAAITVVRFISWGFKRLSQNGLFLCALAFTSVTATGFLLHSPEGSAFEGVQVICEAVLSAAACGVFRRAVLFCENGKNAIGLRGSTDGACVTITFCLLLGCANTISYLGVSPFTALMFAAVMASALRFGISGGALAAAASSCALGLANPSAIPLGFGLTAAGLVAGAFSRAGRFAVACGFSAALAVSFFLGYSYFGGGFSLDGRSIAVETAIAAAVFLVIPHRLLAKLDYLFPRREAVSDKSSVHAMKLLSIARALDETAEEVGSVLEEQKDRADGLMRAVSRRICTDCCFYDDCFRKNLVLIDRLYRREDENTPAKLVEMCARQEDMSRAISDALEQRNYREQLKAKADAMRQVLSGSLSACGRILKNTACKMNDDSREDNEISDRLRREFLKEGINPLGIAAKTDETGRLRAVVELDRDCRAETERIRRLIRRASDRKIQAVRIFSPEDYGVPSEGSRLSLVRVAVAYEDFAFSVRTAVAQRCRSGVRLCGDVCQSFESGRSFVMTLCDGMGTGSRAAMTGMLVSRMLKSTLASGLDLKTALDIAGSAVAVRSDEENLCTADIAQIDLNTAQLGLTKAGGAPSFIRTRGEIIDCGKTGLPIGILDNASAESESFRLEKGDMIVLVSDGMLSGGGDRIAGQIRDFCGGDIQRLADEILDRAIAEQGGECEDDMSVFVGLIA